MIGLALAQCIQNMDTVGQELANCILCMLGVK